MNIYRPNYEGNVNNQSGRMDEARGDDENQECEESKYCCEEKKCVLSPNRTFLKCSAPLTTNIPTTTEAGTTINLANLNIDTSKFHDPCIKFEFAGNILTASGSIILNFRIMKQCKYQPATFPIGPVWTFSRLGASVGENDVFTFPVCDCDVCEDECCNYSVVVTIEQLVTQGDIEINNATLSALVIDRPYC